MSEMFGQVQEVPRTEKTPYLSSLTLRSRQTLRPLNRGQLSRVLRHSRLLGHPLQSLVALARPGVRYPQEYFVAGPYQAQAAGSAQAGEPRGPARLGFRG